MLLLGIGAKGGAQNCCGLSKFGTGGSGTLGMGIRMFKFPISGTDLALEFSWSHFASEFQVETQLV